MTIRRRRLVAAGCLAPLTVSSAMAQLKGTSPIRLVCGVAAGGSLDQMARVIATKMKHELGGRAVLVENKPGANMAIASKYVSTSPPDGTTLLVGTASILLNAALGGADAVDPLQDLTPLDLYNTVPLVVVVNPSKIPAKTMKDLVNQIRARPGHFNASSGVTFMNVAGEVLMKMTGTKFMQIPYSGTAPAMKAVVGGEADLSVMDLATAAPFVRQGQIKALMVSSEERSAMLPDVPTSREAGYPDFQMEAWGGIWAPKNTPEDIVASLHEVLKKVMADSEVQDLIAAKGAKSTISTPAKFVERIRRESAEYKKVVEEQGISIK